MHTNTSRLLGHTGTRVGRLSVAAGYAHRPGHLKRHLIMGVTIFTMAL